MPETWARWSAPFVLAAGESAEVDVRVLVDRSIVEVFAMKGRVAGLLAYLPGMGGTAVHLFAGESAGEATGVEVHETGCGSE